MTFLRSIPIWGWFDIGFNMLVLIALCGESHWALKLLIPNNSQGKTSVKWRREKLKKKFEFLLIVGIAGEIGCLPFSLYESASSNLEAKQAEKDAAGLKAEVLSLEAKTKGRIVDDETKRDLIEKLRSYSPKGHIEVVMFQYDHEAIVFGRSITNALIEAGFEVSFSPRIVFNLDKEGVLFAWKGENRGVPPPSYAETIAETLATNGVKGISGSAYNDTLNTNDIQIFIGAQSSDPQ